MVVAAHLDKLKSPKFEISPGNYDKSGILWFVCGCSCSCDSQKINVTRVLLSIIDMHKTAK